MNAAHRHAAVWMLTLAATTVRAHDPIFGLGPHVLYQGGVEIAPTFHLEQAGEEREIEAALELTYGITGDWAAGIEVPYVWKAEDDEHADGIGDVALFTKYRFWRRDTLGVQQSAALALKLHTSTGDPRNDPPTGSGSTDLTTGLAYGYESRRWYRWASFRYRFNGENARGFQPGDKIKLDLVGGVRPWLTGYLEPDTVLMLELNLEHQFSHALRGRQLPDTGGTELFVSPGVFWTLRNFAVKAGVQIPVLRALEGDQPGSDYRVKLVLEWHM
jgi:hypothetical protein